MNAVWFPLASNAAPVTLNWLVDVLTLLEDVGIQLSAGIVDELTPLVCHVFPYASELNDCEMPPLPPPSSVNELIRFRASYPYPWVKVCEPVPTLIAVGAPLPV